MMISAGKSMRKGSLLKATGSASAQLAWVLILHRLVRTTMELELAFSYLPVLFIATGILTLLFQWNAAKERTLWAFIRGGVLCILFLLRLHMLHYCGLAFTSLVESAHLCLTPQDLFASKGKHAKAVIAIAGGYTLALAFSSASTHPPSLLFHLLLCIASVALKQVYVSFSEANQADGIVTFGTAALLAFVSSYLFAPYLVSSSMHLPLAEATYMSPTLITIGLIVVGILAIPSLISRFCGDIARSRYDARQAKYNALMRLCAQIPLTLSTYVTLDISLHSLIHAMLSFGALISIIWGSYELLIEASLNYLDGDDLPFYNSTPANPIWKRFNALDSASKKILLFLTGNVLYMFVEFFVGYWTNSLGLWSDAGHMLFDNLSLVIGLIAAILAKTPRSNQFTYGYHRIEVLSGFVNSILLLLMAGHFMMEAFERVFEPPTIHTDHLLLTSIGGLIMNCIGLIWFHDLAHGHCSGHSHNSNLIGVYLHVLADTLGSIGVIVSTICIDAFGWYIMDPLCSALISVLVFGSTWPLLKDTSLELLQGISTDSMSSLNIAENALRAQEDINDVQLYAWQQGNCGLVVHVNIIASPSSKDNLLLIEKTRMIVRSNVHAHTVTIEIVENCEKKKTFHHTPPSSCCHHH
ncbi:Cation Diffusion Facilitator (CDF) Family [Thraustotheca clavata]|uniref:Cation Diffusion Facilitator (CDF) Family n=1 Tax=Thraustotheca clavata TaxID=74557 RepID=A0A1W0A2X7_9STRA|nr:Cation Diffusion Facilitator (CDF) Family [Thraustotheca clavata]